MGAQYSPDSQYDWRSAQFQHCNMFPQASFNPDYARSDYTALLESNYALAQAQITQVQINQVTTYSRMKEDNTYPPSAHITTPNNYSCKEKGYLNYPPIAHTSLSLTDHLQKSKILSNPSSDSPNLINSNNNPLSNSNSTQLTNGSYNWMKNEDWNHHGNNAPLSGNVGNEQQQISNYYHQNPQRNYWS